MYFSHIITIFQTFIAPWNHALGGSSLFQINLSLCHLFGTLILFYLQNYLLFLMTILEAKFSKCKTFFLHLLKSVNNKHTLFELVSRWSVHHHTSLERLHSGRETWLSTIERTSTSSEMQLQSKNTKEIQKELAKMKTWKGSLGNRERPGGLKTRKGGPGKKLGAQKRSILPVDWKPEGAIQAKVRDFHKQKQKQKKRLLKHVEGRTLCSHLQMATSPRLSFDNELASQEASVATLCQALHRQWFS